MKDKILMTILLLFAFAAPFIITTALTDAWCRANGSYTQGTQDERSLENGFR